VKSVCTGGETTDTWPPAVRSECPHEILRLTGFVDGIERNVQAHVLRCSCCRQRRIDSVERQIVIVQSVPAKRMVLYRRAVIDGARASRSARQFLPLIGNRLPARARFGADCRIHFVEFYQSSVTVVCCFRAPVPAGRLASWFARPAVPRSAAKAEKPVFRNWTE